MEITRECSNETISITNDNQGPVNRIQMHALLVLYDVWAGAPGPCAKATMTFNSGS